MSNNSTKKKLNYKHTNYKKYKELNMTSFNEQFINILEQLKILMTKKGEPFRASAYQKAMETIMKYQEPITNPTIQLKGLPGIGTTILSKLEEFVKTGSLSTLENEKDNPINFFTDIHGIGPKKAEELIKLGITSISQLRENQSHLNDIQKIGLKYYDDIKQRIPREEIDDFFITLSLFFEENAPKGSSFDIVGSYRRGLSNSGDIDVIITNEFNDFSVFNIIIDLLIKEKIIIEVLSRGKIKSLVIAKIYPENNNCIARRIDFLYSPPSEYSFAILYFTGSKIFNTIMRQRALDLGYTLNEHGISYMKYGIKYEKVIQEFPSEKSIFDFLGIKFQKPEERIDGLTIEYLWQTSNTKKYNSENDFPISKTSKNITLKKPKLPSLPQLVNKFQLEGIDFLKTLTEEELNNFIELSNEVYYSEKDNSSFENQLSDNLYDFFENQLSDNLYDILIEYTTNKYPKNIITKIGHTSNLTSIEKNKIKLPYQLWSMDKIKPDTQVLKKWINKYPGPYVISCKLDGISALYVCKNKEEKFYTRGNGIEGQDITSLIQYIIKKNKLFNNLKNVAIRGEIIIKKEIFQEKYKNNFSNPRNFVAGIVNKKTINPEILLDLDFIPYEVIEPIMKPSEQIEYLLGEWPWPCVEFTINDKISNEYLSNLLLKWRDTYIYEIDGIIIVNDEIYSRPEKNPEYAFAFKMIISDQIAESKVLDVIWTPSKDGYLKPRIRIEPVILGGAKIEYATGKNAHFIQENKVGIGAVVKIVRSGDVIPDIKKGDVIVPAENPKMPNIPYKWNDTNIDILLINKEDNDVVKEKNIVGFFKGIGVDGFGGGNINKLIKAGFNSVPKIIAMKKEDYLKIDGFKDKLATKICEGIKNKIENASLAELMHSSNIFGRGFGEKKFLIILMKYPDILINCDSSEKKINNLTLIEGIARKTAEAFVDKIPLFKEFMVEAGLAGKDEKNLIGNKLILNSIDNEIEGVLKGKKILMTGFRDKELMEKIKEEGGENVNSVSNNTDIVLVKDKSEDTGKADQARKLNIPLMTPDEFKNKYF